jgi:hypothetical protein
MWKRRVHVLSSKLGLVRRNEDGTRSVLTPWWRDTMPVSGLATQGDIAPITSQRWNVILVDRETQAARQSCSSERTAAVLGFGA